MAEIEYVINLAPKAQFQRGDSLTIRAAHAEELVGVIEDAKKRAELLAFFAEEAWTGVNVTAGAAIADPQDLVTKHLGPGTEDVATEAQLTVLTKKLGYTAEDVAGLSKKRASELITKGKK